MLAQGYTPIHPRRLYRPSLIPPLSAPDQAHLLPNLAAPTRITSTTSVTCPRRPMAQWIAPTRGQIIATRASVPPRLWETSGSRTGDTSTGSRETGCPRPYSGPTNELAGGGGGGSSEKCGGNTEDGEERECVCDPGRGAEYGPRHPRIWITDDSTLNPKVSPALREFLPTTYPTFEQGRKPELEVEWVSTT
jgi:hypothetical protein